jgi:hypothetical protein
MPLFETWASLLHDLLGGEETTLVVPNLEHLDQQSIAVLRSLYRKFPDSAPHLVLGWDPGIRSPIPDSRGLIWSYEPLDLQKVVFAFQLLGNVEAQDLPPEDGEGADEPREPPAADDLESRAFAALAAGSGPLDDAHRTLVIRALRGAFESFGFRVALRLGLALLEREGELEGEEAAEVHGIVALSAHNRQFRTAGNLVLARFLADHYSKAFAAETRPAVRAALLYRLAVTHGRRLKDVEAGMEWSNRALAEPRELGLGPVAVSYYESWALNIRSFVQMQSRRLDRAVEDGERAFRLLEEARPKVEELSETERARWPREVFLSQAVLVANMSTLAILTDQPDVLAGWRQRGGELSDGVREMDRYQAMDWIDFYRRRQQLRLALPWARLGLEAGRRDQDPLWEYHHTLQHGDLAYRLGDPALAAGELARAREQRRLLDDPVALRVVDPLLATALRRAGRLEKARELYAGRLESGEETSLDVRAELLSALGLVAAEAGDAEEAEARINQAIDLAVESGERDTLLRVAAAAGAASLQLDHPEDAAQAYTQALEVAGANEADDDGAPAPAADVLEVCVGIQGCRGFDPGLTERALAHLPEALESAETWWHLAALLPHAAEWVRRHGAPGEAPATAGLRQLVHAAAQRPDCAAGLEALRAALPDSLQTHLEEGALEAFE